MPQTTQDEMQTLYGLRSWSSEAASSATPTTTR